MNKYHDLISRIIKYCWENDTKRTRINQYIQNFQVKR
jgi:hypothetical protein